MAEDYPQTFGEASWSYVGHVRGLWWLLSGLFGIGTLVSWLVSVSLLLTGFLAGMTLVILFFAFTAKAKYEGEIPIQTLGNISALARNPEPAPPISVTGQHLEDSRCKEVRSEWDKLSSAQKNLLTRILINDGLNWHQIDNDYWNSLPIYVDWDLSDYLLDRSTLLEHKSKGAADLRRYIASRKAGKPEPFLGVRTWKVKPEFRNALEILIRNQGPTSGNRYK